MACSTPFPAPTFHRMVPCRHPNPSHSVEEMARGIVFYRCETGIEPTLTNNKWTVQVEINRLLIYPKKTKDYKFSPG